MSGTHIVYLEAVHYTERQALRYNLEKFASRMADLCCPEPCFCQPPQSP